jgi:hypothetical protein
MNVFIIISILTATVILGEFRHRYQLKLEDQHEQAPAGLKA